MLQNLTELKHTLAPVFASYDISRAVLFGSLAAGTATETSDLDLMALWKLCDRPPACLWTFLTYHILKKVHAWKEKFKPVELQFMKNEQLIQKNAYLCQQN